MTLVASTAGLAARGWQLLWDIGGADRTLLDPTQYPEGFDIDARWSAIADENIKLVNELLTKLRRQSEAAHAEILPFVQAVPRVADRVLAIARRQAGKR